MNPLVEEAYRIADGDTMVLGTTEHVKACVAAIRAADDDYAMLRASYVQTQHRITDLETRIHGLEEILVHKDREIERLRAIETAHSLEVEK